MSGENRIPRGVNRQLWAEALELAGGDAERLEVRSATAVVVHNTAGWTTQEPGRAASAAVPSRRPRKQAPKRRSKARARSGQPLDEPLDGRPLPTPEWRSAAPAHPIEPTASGPVTPKSDVPAFLAPQAGR